MLTHETIKKQNLIPGRAGELTLYANLATFDLLEKIFGFNGPYRAVLQEFGVKVLNTNESYLVLKDGMVYTDITKEARILWGNYPVRYVINGSNVQYETFLTISNFTKVINLFMKSVYESWIIINCNTYTEKAFALYKEVSEDVERIFVARQLDLKKFLDIYKKIIYVTYLYELFELYNKEKIISKHLNEYISANDYLMSDAEDIVEHYLKLDKGFYLDNYPNLEEKLADLRVKKFIPSVINRFSSKTNIPSIQICEKELQCLKNNLRLKTNVLLYFLNLTMLKHAPLPFS